MREVEAPVQVGQAGPRRGHPDPGGHPPAGRAGSVLVSSTAQAAGNPFIQCLLSGGENWFLRGEKKNPGYDSGFGGPQAVNRCMIYLCY